MTDARDNFNMEMLELWLGAFAGGYEHPKDDSESNNPNKGSSEKLPFNMAWMLAHEDPAVRDTDRILRHIVMEQMPNRKPMTYWLFESLYLREEANPAEVQRWAALADMTRLRKLEGVKNPTTDVIQLREQIKMSILKMRMLHRGKVWILRQAAKEGLDILHVPDPIHPEGFVAKSQKAQRIARRVFWRDVAEVGEVKARERAAAASGYSARHLRNLLPPGISHKKED